MEQKVRMADIAEKLNISVVSVSKALSGKDGVSDRMREKIRATAREMGYVPLRSRPAAEPGETTGCIGILVPDRYFDVNTFYASLYRVVSQRCNQFGFSAMLEIVSAEAERSGAMPAIVQSGKVDGLIFLGQLARNYLQVMARSGIPYILLDFYDEDLDTSSVTSDNVAGGYRLTRHLLKRGYREIGFIGSIDATSSIMDRFLGYSKAMLKAGIPIHQEWILEDRDADGALTTLTLPEKMPRAFLCSCDSVAYNLLEQLKRMGLRVPEDVAVAGYDDYRIAALSQPQLTTYQVNTEQMSWIAVEQLIQAIKGKPMINGNIVVNGVLIHREST